MYYMINDSTDRSTFNLNTGDGNHNTCDEWCLLFIMYLVMKTFQRLFTDKNKVINR